MSAPDVDDPEATFCGCCGRQTFPRRDPTRPDVVGRTRGADGWCVPCSSHVARSRYTPPWDRTYAAINGGADCPWQV